MRSQEYLNFAPVPDDESDRLVEVRRVCSLNLNTRREERFDRLSRIACAVFDVPVSMVAWMDDETQFIKSAQGVDLATAPRDVSFCGHAIYQESVLVVPDTLLDERFANNPWVVGQPHARFYAGCPVRGPRSGRVIGTVCVFDLKPRHPTLEQLDLLRALAEMAEQEIAIEDAVRRTWELSQNRDELRTYFDESCDLIFWSTADGSICYANSALMQRLGYPAGLVPKQLSEVARIDARPKPIEHSYVEHELIARDGSRLPVRGHMVSGHYEGQPVTRWTFRDISQERVREARLSNAALTDELTRVFNRRGFHERLGAILRDRPTNAPLVIAMVDVDGLKKINDVHGHAAGDQAIRRVAHLLKSGTRSSDAVGRLGGDEFAVALTLPLETATQVMARFSERLQSDSSGPVRYSASVGLIEVQPTATVDSALKLADEFLYRAKRSGRGRVVSSASIEACVTDA